MKPNSARPCRSPRTALVRLASALCLGVLCLGVLAPQAALASADTTPPTQPPAPTFNSTTTTATNVFWGQSTDNVAVTGYYLQELTSSGWTTIRTVGPFANYQTIYGLAPATSYTFGVIAFDAAGNTSPRSAPATVTTLATTPFATCTLQTETYDPGFTDYLDITNTTTAPISGWTVQFTMPAGVSVLQSFGGTAARTGPTTGTITPFSYNFTITPGVQSFVGFNGSASPFILPSSFTFDGRPCTSS